MPPSASASAADITSVSSVNPSVSVKYTDDNAVNAATLDSNDLRVVGPGGFNSPLALSSVGAASGGSVTAGYTLTAPAGGWTASRNGTYYVVAQSNQVLDNDGNAVPAAAIGSFTVNIDAAPPIASASVPSVTAPSTNTKTVTVTYTDGTAVNTATLGTGNVTVTGPSFSVTPTFVSFTGAGGAVTATYTFSPPNSATTGWQSSNNGTYTINLVAGQVADTSGNTAAAGSVGSFTVTLDTTAPTAAASASTVTSASASVPITVTYTDANPGVRFSTLDAADVRVTGPNAFNSAVTLQSVSPSSDGSPITATYLLAPPAGGWTAASNGSYSVVLQASQVSDTAGNVAATATIGSFTVALDTTAPTATASAANIATAGSSAETFTVTFADAGTGVNVATLGAGDVVVTGPGYNAAATFVSVDVNANGTPRTATYSVPAPSGGWANASNGAYTIALQANQVADVAGNFAAAQNVGSFQVAVPTPTPTSTAYSNTILSDNPLAYYRLGEASGTTAADASGHGLPATYTGGVTLGQAGAVSGDANTAARLDGTSGYVNAGHPQSFDVGAGDLSVEAWIKPTTTAVRQQVAAKDSATGRSFVLELSGAAGQGGLTFWLFDTAGGFAAFSTPAGLVAAGQWSHVVAERSGGVVQIFVNGSNQPLSIVPGSKGLPVTLPSTATDLTFGARRYGGYEDWFQGSIDEAAVYNSALPASRVTAHYNAGRGIFTSTAYPTAVLPDAPAAYYRADEASGTAATDASGNGRSGAYAGGVTLGQTGALSGDSDTSARLDGTSGYLNAGHPSAFNFGSGDLAVEAWVKPDSIAARQQVAAKDASTGREFTLELSGAAGQGGLTLWLLDGSGGYAYLSTPAGVVPAAQWSHIVAQRHRRHGADLCQRRRAIPDRRRHAAGVLRHLPRDDDRPDLRGPPVRRVRGLLPRPDR